MAGQVLESVGAFSAGLGRQIEAVARIGEHCSEVAARITAPFSNVGVVFSRLARKRGELLDHLAGYGIDRATGELLTGDLCADELADLARNDRVLLKWLYTAVVEYVDQVDPATARYLRHVAAWLHTQTRSVAFVLVDLLGGRPDLPGLVPSVVLLPVGGSNWSSPIRPNRRPDRTSGPIPRGPNTEAGLVVPFRSSI